MFIIFLSFLFLASTSNEIDLSLCCDLSVSEWSSTLVSLQNYTVNFTGILPSSFELSSTGYLTMNSDFSNLFQNTQNYQLVTQLQSLDIGVYPLMAASSGAVVLATNDTLNQQFLANLTALVTTYKLNGLSIDLEGPTNDDKSVGDEVFAWLNSISQTLLSLDSENKLLVFIHSCPTGDFHIDCGLFNPTKDNTTLIPDVILMDTYTANRDNWVNYFQTDLSYLGNVVYNVGFEYNQNLSPYYYGPENLNYMLSKGVTKFTTWVNLPPNNQYWELFGQFIQGKINVTNG